MQFIDLNAQQSIVRDKIDQRIKKVLDHGQYIMGPEIDELEEKLAHYVNTKHCISCSSGTDALLIPLMAMGIGPGDAVITTPFTYIATVEVIALLGATPIFCDIYDRTFNINPSGLEQAYNDALSKNLQPKAIIPVDLFGLPARYRLIEEFANKKNLFILEDAAQGFGGKIGDKLAGSFGEVAGTSFFPAKPLGCYGDGGAIFTNNDKLSEKIKSIRIHGGGKDKYDNDRIGINGRLDSIQAAVLLEKIEIFNDELSQREKVAQYYTHNIHKMFTTPLIPSKYISSWAQYSILIPDKLDRNKVIEDLYLQGIPSMIYYKTPVHLQKGYEKYGYSKGDFQITENISNRILSLPMHPYLEQDDQNHIISVLNKYS
ncbi:MAG: aminotransferase DegT [Legionellales bacterium]|nr:aminotransferase DegT [Legionellales bacterium]|tara:strand:+ start:1127 stop:2245 length:1119 start_codon:yes stop_codon:yes gene_type:complete